MIRFLVLVSVYTVFSSANAKAATPGSELWNLPGAGLNPPAAFRGTTAYVQSRTSGLQCIDLRTGKEVWRNALETWRPEFEPVVGENGNVYLANGESVSAFDGASGEVRWKIPLPTSTRMAIGDNDVLHVPSGKELVRIDARGGSIIDRLPLPGTATEFAIATDGNLLIRDGGSRLSSYSVPTSTRNWQRGESGRFALAPDGIAYVSRLRSSSGPVDLAAVGAHNGQDLWHLEWEFSARETWSIHDLPVLIGPDASIYIIGDGILAADGANRRTLWKSPLPNGSKGAGASLGDDGLLYVVDSSGKLHALQTTDGRLRWTASVGRVFSRSPVLAGDGVLLVACTDGSLSGLAVSSDLPSSGWLMEGGDPRKSRSQQVSRGAPSFAPQVSGGVTGLIGGTITLGSLVGGERPIHSRWIKDGAPLLPNDRQSGTDRSVLRVSGLGLGDAGTYSLICSNALGVATNGPIQLVIMPPASGQIVWRFMPDNDQTLTSPPVLAPDGTLVAAWMGSGGQRTELFAIDTALSTERWRQPTSNRVDSVCVGLDGTLYYTDGAVHALEAGTGKVLWSRETGATFPQMAVTADGRLFVSSGSNVVVLATSTGDILSRLPAPTNVTSLAVGHSGELLLRSGPNSPRLHSLQPDDGAVRWLFGGPIAEASILPAPGGRILVNNRNHRVALDATDGDWLWSHMGSTDEIGSSLCAMSPEGTFVEHNTRGVQAIDSASGAVVWQTPPNLYEDGVVPAIAQDGTVFVVGSFNTGSAGAGLINGVLTALDRRTGLTRWQTVVGDATIHVQGVRNSPVIAPDGTIYLAMGTGEVLAVAHGSPLANGHWSRIQGDNLGSASRFEPSPTPSFRHSLPATLERPAGTLLRMPVEVIAFPGTPLQWYKNGVPLDPSARIDGTTSPVLQVRDLEDSDGGDYALVAGSGPEARTNAPVTLKVSRASPGQVRWKRRLPILRGQSPALGRDGTVYVANGIIPYFNYALDGSSGSIRWCSSGRQYSGTPNGMAPVVGPDGVGYLGSDAVDLRDGARLWSALGLGEPAIEPGDVLYTARERTLTSRVASSGEVLWSTNIPVQLNWGTFQTRLAVGSNLVYATLGSTGDSIAAFRRKSGTLAWRKTRGAGSFADISAPTVNRDGTVFVSLGDQRAYALNGETGSVLWTRFLSGEGIESPVLGGASLVFFGGNQGGGSGGLLALDQATGRVVWEYPTTLPVRAAPVLTSDGNVIVISRDGRLSALDVANGQERWTSHLGEPVYVSPVLGPAGDLVVMTGNGTVVSLTGTAGPADSDWPMHGRNAQHTGSSARLAPPQGPQILLQPQDQAVDEGQPLQLALIAQGSSELSFRWRQDGQTLDGVFLPALRIDAAAPNHAGSYDVVVNDASGSVTSRLATVTVRSRPRVLRQPVPLAVVEGRSARFSVEAEGFEPLEYHWRFEGTAIPGARAASLTIDPVVPSSAGLYQAVITNPVGSTNSTAVRLTVLPGEPPMFSGIGIVNGRFELRWPGSSILQTTTNIVAGWEDVLDTSGSYSVAADGSVRFFRLRRR